MARKPNDHLRNDYLFPVRDPLWKHIYLSQGMKSILETADYIRLDKIRQLGPASIIYPGATHSRFNHSLGVFYLAFNIIQRLLSQEGGPDYSLEGIKGFLCAALLHDLGHFPHAHSFKELPLKDHEALSAQIILDGPIAKILRDQIGTDPEFCAAIIDTARTHSQKEELTFYRNILSGVLDPDKLDYLTRDAYFCGVPYGIQDSDYVLSQLIALPHSMAIPFKGISAIENVLFSKYLMYKTVYWHKGVRISTALVKKAVYLALKEGQLNPQQLYGMDDQNFLHTMLSLQPEIKSMMEQSERPYGFEILHSWNYEPLNSSHKKLMDLDMRFKKEEELRDFFKKSGINFEMGEVLLDLTGKISFEVELPVMLHGEALPFPETETVFSREVVKDFTTSLQKIRLIVPREGAEKIRKSLDFEEILQIIHI